MDWNTVRLAVFDVDGTLYNQRRLRLNMAYELLLHALRSRSLGTARMLSSYRRLREQLADDEVQNFEQVLLTQTADRCGLPPATVAALAAEWLEQRPLRHIRACRYDGLPELFQRLRVRGKRIAILSDYPAPAKLQAVGLAADIIVCAGDVGVLKPHPHGLQRVMALAGAAPGATVMIGDRPERDGAAARRSGVHALIKSRRPLPGWQTFATYRDPVFTVQL
jgi:HAD superfamily hydrolase (TIGR01549 family)